MKTKYTILALTLFNIAVFAQDNSSIILPNTLKVPAVSIFPSLPNSPKGSLAYYNNDNKIYFSTGSTWKTITEGITLPHSTTQIHNGSLLTLRNNNTPNAYGLTAIIQGAGIAIEGYSGTNGISVLGHSTGNSNSIGVLGENEGNGMAVRGVNTGAGFGGYFLSSNGVSLYATSNSATGTGLIVNNTNPSGYALSISGKTSIGVNNAYSPTGRYLKNVGDGNAEWADPYIYSYTNTVPEIVFTNSGGTAIEAVNGASSGGAGIRGIASNTNQGASGVFGVVGVNLNGATNGVGGGVYGVDNANGIGVYGVAVGSSGTGVKGLHAGAGTGGDFQSGTGYALKVLGKVRLDDKSNATNGKVLVANDQNGNAVWSEASAFGAYVVSSINIASGSNYTLIFPQKYEKNINYNASTGATTIALSGIYHFDGCVRFESATTNVYIDFVKNGSIINTWTDSSLGAYESIRFSFDYELDAGNTINFQVFHSSGNPKNIIATSYLTGHLVR